MTTASKGLVRALGRSSSGDTIALAEMTTEDLMANLTDEHKAALSAALAPLNAAAKGKGENDAEDAAEGPEGSESDAEDAAEGDEGQDGKKPGMGKSKADAAPLKSNASINARVQAVAAAVASDDPCKGKAGLALSMLADDDFVSLNAAAIIKIVGSSGADASGGDAEAGARADMKAALSETRNSKIATGPGSGASADDNPSIGWAKATAEVNRRNGFKD